MLLWMYDAIKEVLIRGENQSTVSKTSIAGPIEKVKKAMTDIAAGGV